MAQNQPAFHIDFNFNHNQNTNHYENMFHGQYDIVAQQALAALQNYTIDGLLQTIDADNPDNNFLDVLVTNHLQIKLDELNLQLHQHGSINVGRRGSTFNRLRAYYFALCHAVIAVPNLPYRLDVLHVLQPFLTLNAYQPNVGENTGSKMQLNREIHNSFARLNRLRGVRQAIIRLQQFRDANNAPMLQTI